MMESGKENKVTEIIIEMIQHDNLAIRYEGIVLAMRHKINAAVPYIVKEKENGATPDGYGNFGGKSRGQKIPETSPCMRSDLLRR